MAKKNPSLAPASLGMDMQWRAEEDLRTLARAEEIRADKKRFAAAKEVAKAQIAAIGKNC